MHATVRYMIESNMDLIDQNEFAQFYSNIEGYNQFIQKATEALYAAGIDPLPHLTVIPAHFRMEGTCTEVNIPPQIKRIEQHAFNGCRNLHTITGLESSSVSLVGAMSFANCIHLQSVTLPETLEHLGNGSFMYCSELKEITILSPKCTVGGIQIFRMCPEDLIVRCRRTNHPVIQLVKQVDHYSKMQLQFLDD